MIPIMTNTQRDALARDFQDQLALCGVKDPVAIKRLTRQAVNMAAAAFIDGIGAYLDQKMAEQKKEGIE